MKSEIHGGSTITRRKLTLTNTAVKGAVPGEILWDTEVTGLHLQAFKDRKSFYLYYCTKTGRQRRPKLGDAKIISLTQAREDARAILAKVARGEDPMADRELVMESPTVDALFERVYRDHWRGKKTAREIRRRFEAHVQGGRLGKLRVREAAYDDVVAVHAAMKGTPYQANRVLTDLAKMFNYAERPLKWRERHTNPCSGVTPYPEQKRKKFYKREHLQRLVPVLEAFVATEGTDRIARARRRAGAFLTFQLYTGARPEEPEVITPEMVEVDPEGGAVARLPDSKCGQRDIYLPPQALRALCVLPWVKGRPILGRFPRKLWSKIRVEAGCGDLWARDTRRTFGTAVGSTAHGAQAGMLLGHASAQTTKRYLELVEDAAQEAAAAGAARIDEMARTT